jgi:hypothetical protein
MRDKPRLVKVLAGLGVADRYSAGGSRCNGRSRWRGPRVSQDSEVNAGADRRAAVTISSQFETLAKGAAAPESEREPQGADEVRRRRTDDVARVVDEMDAGVALDAEALALETPAER